MTARHYSNTAAEMTLMSSVSDSDTAFTLDDVTGLPPSFPFVLVVDPGETGEEALLCTAVVGVTATVTRGYDNTPASAHPAAAKVRHMSVAADFRDAQEHINNTSAVHGVAGSVVGTSDAQILANKSISGLTNTLSDIQKASLPTDTVYLATSQTLTGKTISGATNTLTNIPDSALPTDVVYLTDTQTLTNKTLTAPTITGATLDGDTNTFADIPQSAVTDLEDDLTDRAMVSANKRGEKIHWGVASITSHASTAYATITHGCGFTPTVVVATAGQGYQMGVDNIDATSFRVRVLQADGSIYTNQAATVYYFCGE